MARSRADHELDDYLDIARRRKWTLLGITVLALVAAILFTAIQTPQYRGVARVRVEASGRGTVLDDNSNVISTNVRDRNLRNEVEFANSDRVRVRVLDEIGSLEHVTVAAAPNSDALTFVAQDANGARAAEIANIFAQAYVAERSLASGEQFLAAVDVIDDRLAEISVARLDLEGQLATSNDPSSVQIQLDSLASEEVRLRGQLNEIDVLSQLNNAANVSVLNAAEPPGSPFAPSWIRNIGLAVAAGLALGIGVVLVLETLDDTILTKRDLEDASDGVPVLSLIPAPHSSRFQSKVERKLVTTRTGAFTESFRSLRSAIELGQAAGSEIRSILVTSANPSEGKSTVAAHLAVAFARSGANVLVIDADLHNPTQHQLFGVENEAGLADQFAKLGNAEIVTEQTSGEALVSLIPAGASGSSPAELLQSAVAQEFIEKMADTFDLVIIDSPPLRPIADTLPLARIADATLLVSMRGKTNSVDVQDAMELLTRAKTRPLGMVLTDAEYNDARYGYGPRAR